MKIAGIICEYNPFHAGHALHIAKTREALGGNSGIVCVMSGNFVQRGEPAVMRKHARARAAVMCGADLVLENPLPWAVSSAERFAFGGVSVLDALGVCTHLSFGSECGNAALISKCASAISSEEGLRLIKEAMKSGVTYAKAVSDAAKNLGADASVLENPNDTLAVEYMRALSRLKSDMEPIAVLRTGAMHDEKCGASGAFLREILKTGGDFSAYVPEKAAEVYAAEISGGRAPVMPESMENSVMARLRTMTDAEFAALPDAAEGLDRRFSRAAHEEPDIESFLAAVKTKRYVLSRIRRMTVSAYLGLSAPDSEGEPPYARVLAANENGREILARVSEKGRMPVLTKPASVREMGERALYIFEKEARATDLFSLAFPKAEERRGGQEWRTSPVML